MRKVIIDTDIGLDDLEALVYITACKDIEILAITLVSGNASSSLTSENCTKLLSLLQKEHIPIYRGGDFNLEGKLVLTDGYFGTDGLAGIKLPPTTLQVKNDMKAAEALVHYAQKYPNEVELVCIGPLTNLALAFLLNNEFPKHLRSITVMGTDTAAISTNNITPYAEFNVYKDTQAYLIIMKCFGELVKPITLINWNLCQTNLVNPSILDKLYEDNIKKNVHIELISKIRDFDNEIIKRTKRPGGMVFCDLLAVSLWHDESILKHKKRVNIKSLEIGGERHGHVEFEDDPNGSFDLVDEVDTDKLVKNYLSFLKSA